MPNKEDGKMEKVMKMENLLSKLTCTTLPLVIEEKEKKKEEGESSLMKTEEGMIDGLVLVLF